TVAVEPRICRCTARRGIRMGQRKHSQGYTVRSMSKGSRYRGNGHSTANAPRTWRLSRPNRSHQPSRGRMSNEKSAPPMVSHAQMRSRCSQRIPPYVSSHEARILLHAAETRGEPNGSYGSTAAKQRSVSGDPMDALLKWYGAKSSVGVDEKKSCGYAEGGGAGFV